MEFSLFDGTDRKPRDAQVQALKWLTSNWNQCNVFALNLPTGVGKSAILRAIQLQFPGTIGVVPTNILMDQYIQTYPNVNYYRGAEHYTCGEGDYTCQDKNLLGIKHEKDCSYRQNRAQALEGHATVYNPISLFYLTKSDKFKAPEIVVVDEAHKLPELLMLLSDCSFRKGRYQYPEINNDIELVTWLTKVQADLKTLEKHAPGEKKKLELSRQIERVGFVLNGVTRNPQDFVYYTKTEPYRGSTDEYLYISPIRPAKWLIDTILQGRKIILMSATLLKSDLWGMGFKDFKYLDMASPIPAENRPVVYLPHEEPMNFRTPEASVARYIQGMLDRYPDRNTVVHLSYGWAERLKKYFPDALCNTPETKTKVLAQFKKKGGVWLAAGCAEGIDLPGEECRLTIIPMVLRANPNDPVTKKQIAQQGGWLLYELSALKTLIQQAGRGTRGIDDHSITVIGDSSFPRLINKNRQYIPASFLDAIVWRSK